MKTTLELPDALLIEAKATAARQRITLKKLFTRALRRAAPPAPSTSGRFTIDKYGWPVLNREPDCGIVITDEFVNRLREEEGI